MKQKERRKPMTKFSYSEVQPAYTSSQSARLESLPSFNTVEATLEQFASSISLSGPGWDSAKQALAPYSLVSKALYNYHCDFGEIFASFLASFESEVGETSKTLDTEELADLQAKINRLQQEKQDLMLKIAGNIALEIIGGYGVMYKEFQIDRNQKKVDLLQKYEAFETNHANDFSEIKAIGTQLKTALSDLGKAKQFNAKTGKYSKIEYTSYEWYQKLSDYNDSCPTQRMEIVAEYQEAAGHGLTVYKVYINGKYNKEASTNLQWLMLQDSLKMVVDIGGELTGVYDLYRLFFGKDPVTGGAASRLEAGLWTALLLLPTSKIVEGIKEIKAGNRFLRGLDLTADELRILDKAGYFEDVSKIEKLEKTARVPEINPSRNLIDNLNEIADDIRDINKKYADGVEMNNSIENIINSASYYEDHWEQVSAVTRSIAGHAFENGNKRTAFDTLNMLLDDLKLKSPLNDTQKWDLIDKLGKGEIKDVSEIANILKGK
jgi:prophage maintenance system killer protein